MSTLFQKILMMIAILGMTGCAAVGPNYVKPDLKIDDTFVSPSIDSHPRVEPTSSQWWSTFNDAQLMVLVEEAMTGVQVYKQGQMGQ